MNLTKYSSIVLVLCMNSVVAFAAKSQPTAFFAFPGYPNGQPTASQGPQGSLLKTSPPLSTTSYSCDNDYARLTTASITTTDLAYGAPLTWKMTSSIPLNTCVYGLNKISFGYVKTLSDSQMTVVYLYPSQSGGNNQMEWTATPSSYGYNGCCIPGWGVCSGSGDARYVFCTLGTASKK